MWAEIFSASTPELTDYGPYTSKDVDFFGPRRVAEELAAAINAKVVFPSLDDSYTPNTALVYLQIGEFRLEIDFLNFVLGAPRSGVEYIEILMVVSEGEPEQNFRLKVLHPVQCLISRLNTVLHPAINRRDGFALRQLQASVVIVRRYVQGRLSSSEEGDLQEACKCFSMLHDFLLRDPTGRRAHRESAVDPLSILREFATDIRLDERYRSLTLQRMISRMEANRRSSERRQIGPPNKA